MVPFATEFPVASSLNASVFIAQVIGWLRGINDSHVLDFAAGGDLNSESAHLRSHHGEELRFRQLDRGDLRAIGFRHDIPDAAGRLWRTESVLLNQTINPGGGILRVRTQCLAMRPDARLESPRKPYLVKLALEDNWGSLDGNIAIKDSPHYLSNRDDDFKLAVDIINGAATTFLPVVYVSSLGKSSWNLSQTQIERMAFDLGGVAHVAIEPDRAFSFKLKDLSGGTNAYGGAIAVSLPGRGIVKKFYQGLSLKDSNDLLLAVKSTALELRSYLPTHGWDWSELQEAALRLQRERERNRLTELDIEALYQAEIDVLQEKIKQLTEEKVSRDPSRAGQFGGSGLETKALSERIGREVYAGEFSDRLRMAAKLALEVADSKGVDKRSRFVLSQIVSNLPLSAGLSEIKDELRRASKDAKREAGELTAVLARHGYVKMSDNKHIRLVAMDGIGGLDTITLSKTPSDNRGLANARQQIEATLGLTHLKD